MGQKFEAAIEALMNGQPIPLSLMAPPPRAAPPQPKGILEALEQRMTKYQEAHSQAKACRDDRKARMHERIIKQYQSAIRAHKAGRTISIEELPVPPGFPPIPGQESVKSEQGFAAVLEAANKLALDDDKVEDEEVKKDVELKKPPVTQKPKKPMIAVPPTAHGCTPSQKQPCVTVQSLSPERHSLEEEISEEAQKQPNFLDGHRKQHMKAALQARQKNDLDQARSFINTAKGSGPGIESAKRGKTADVTKVPSPPGDEEDDFVLVDYSDVQSSQKTEQIYSQLSKLLKEQHEKCLTYSQQFSHLGNLPETTKFEKMAESCKKNMEILELSQAQGLDPPKHFFEGRTYRTVRICPELSSTEMVVVIVKGMNLPAPQGVAAHDLCAFVKIEFPYPIEQPQRHKTVVIRNTSSPEYNQSFMLTINRNHRGLRRVIQSKGIKLDVLHKGGFLRSDKPVGSALLKLEKLEVESEVREIVEVTDGRKPTGGWLEVRVRLREPLSGQELQTTTERWVVLQQPEAIL